MIEAAQPIAVPRATLASALSGQAGGARGAAEPGAGRAPAAARWPALIVPAALVLMWQAVTAWGHVFPAHQLPSPWQVIATARALAEGGALGRHVTASVARVAAGFGLGALAATALGLAVGLSRTAERAIDPTLQLIRNVPSLAWVPFLLLWLGIGEAPKITLIAIGAFFPVYLNLVAGIRQTDRKLIEVGAVFGLGRVALVRRIVLPSALPYLLTGLRIGIGQGWLFLVAAELIASTRGLGFLLIDGQSTARPDVMLVGILVLAGLGKLCDTALRRLARLPWADGFAGR
jgi:sulfonate transport system permease protein